MAGEQQGFAASKLTNFKGIAPRYASELLPDHNAQIAHNAKLTSGDIVPVREAVQFTDTHRREEIKTLYALRDENNNPVFLSWTTDVDVVPSETDITGEQRFYYTGDGAPKVSTYNLAVQGEGPYPVTAYTLGLPLPSTRLAASFTERGAVGISSISRDASALAKVRTSAKHLFRTGNTVSITGCPAATTETATFNTTNSVVTVLDDYTFTYYSPGEVTAVHNTGSVTLAGSLFARYYLYTWYTPWDEESMPSDVSECIYVRDGETCTITNIPTSSPDTSTYIRGLNVYRTINSTGSSAYMKLATLWFPSPVHSYYQEGGYLYIKMVDAAYVIPGDFICVRGALTLSNVEVEAVYSSYTFSVYTGGDDFDVIENPENTFLYRDTSPIELEDTHRYWGLDGNYSFIDDYLNSSLSEQLDSDDNEAPPTNMKGLTFYNDGMYFGFVSNQLYISKKNMPHAWPSEYVIALDEEIVSLGVSGSYLVILTEGNPYVLSGSNPKTVSYSRIDFPYACLSKRSVVQMGYGIVYATRAGLALYHPNQGMSLLTDNNHSYDSWINSVDPSTVSAAFYQDMYLGAHSKGAFLVTKEPGQSGQQVMNTLVTIDLTMTAGWVDPLTGILYFVPDEGGYVYKFDPKGYPNVVTEWKSKTIISKGFDNFGAARVIADYENPENTQAIINWNNSLEDQNTVGWEGTTQLAAANGPLQYSGDDSMRALSFGSFNTMAINSDNVTKMRREERTTFPVVFRLWRNKKLIFQRSVENTNTFRLPRGYRTDTIEFAVSTDTRVRAIHIGETPHGLRGA